MKRRSAGVWNFCGWAGQSTLIKLLVLPACFLCKNN